MTTAILLVALAAQAIGLPNVSGSLPSDPAPDAGTAHSEVATRPVDAAKRPGRHQISGTMSWHTTGRSGLYAAACRPLRQALGRHWRGRHVLIVVGRKAVEVKLNDWCGSKTKLIDASDEVFRYFRPLSRGTVKVTVGY